MSTLRTSRLARALRRRGLLITAGAAAVAVVGGGATAAVAATGAPATSTAAAASTAASATPCAPGVGPLLRALPQSLKTDLKHLRTDSAADKAKDRAAIKAKALAGGYGLRMERVARIVAGQDGKLTAALPPALKADLKTLRSDPKGSAARKDEAADIWKKALAGTYGSNVESLAKDAKARVDARCAARSSATS